MPTLTHEQSIDYASSYFRKGSMGEDWKLRSLTGEGGYLYEPVQQLPDGSQEIGSEYVDFWENSLTRAALSLHDGVERYTAAEEVLPDTHEPPAIIFLTATRAIPFAFAVKTFWREAYPSEKPPMFKVIDSSDRRFTLATSQQVRAEVEAREVEQLRRLGERYGFDNVAVFEEFANSGHTLKAAEKLLRRAGFSDVNCIHGTFGDPYASILPDKELPIVRQELYERRGPEYEASGRKEYQKLVWNAGRRSRALIQDMKMAGHFMAEEAKKRGLLPDNSH